MLQKFKNSISRGPRQGTAELLAAERGRLADGLRLVSIIVGILALLTAIVGFVR